jgi:uncharacterized RDD family membrane protein YckC
MAYDGIIVLALLLLAGLLALPFAGQDTRALADPLFTLYLLAVWFAYFAWCWRRAGMTLGMRAWRLRLNATNGRRPSWRQCLVRFAVALVSAGMLGAGFAWALFDRQRRCWHDLASGTVLVVAPRRSG